MKRFFLATAAMVFAGVFLAGDAFATPQDFQSGVGQVTLLELYTSEGCSSCPPAEAWLSQFKDSPGLWKNIVPVAFHVNYWDNLGWKDTWATKAFTDRQRAYAAAWNSPTVYTPGFVRNGREWQPVRQIGDATENSTAKPGELRATSTDGKEWTVTFAPVSGLSEDFEVHAVLLGSEMHSNVRGGENGGKQLVHDFAALTLVEAEMQKHGDKQEAEIKFSSVQPKNAGKLALAVWVTYAGKIVPMQATGGWLTE